MVHGVSRRLGSGSGWNSSDSLRVELRVNALPNGRRHGQPSVPVRRSSLKPSLRSPPFIDSSGSIGCLSAVARPNYLITPNRTEMTNV
jgi:hypothetical protein